MEKDSSFSMARKCLGEGANLPNNNQKNTVHSIANIHHIRTIANLIDAAPVCKDYTVYNIHTNRIFLYIFLTV